MEKSNGYWEKRARENKLHLISIENKGIAELKKLYLLNLKDIQKQIAVFYKKYGKNPYEELQYKDVKAYKKALKEAVKKHPEDKTLKRILKEDYPKYKIDRLRTLETDLQVRMSVIAQGQETGTMKTLKDVALVSAAANKKLLKNALNLALGALSDRKAEQIIKQNWIGKGNFSGKIWADRENLGKKLTNVLHKGMTQGKSMQQMSRDLRNITGESYNNCFRLVRTEAAHVDSQVTLEGYKQAEQELGLDEYVFDAHLDNRTSEICRELNGKCFKNADAITGVNLPPMHPNCRSVIVLKIDDYTEPVKELTEFSDLKSFNLKAYGLAQYAKNVEENPKSAVQYARKFFDKNTLNSYFKAGSLNDEQMKLLGCKTPDIKFSMDSMIKNRISHKDVRFSDYAKIEHILKSPDKIISDGENHLKLFKQVDNKIYEAVIKTTNDKKENFFVSLHYSNQRRMKK